MRATRRLVGQKAVRKDADAGKATFVSLLGPEPRARPAATMLVAPGDRASAFATGREADLLRELAHYVGERDR